MSERLSATKTDAGNEVPQPAKCLSHDAAGNQVVRMAEAQKLHQHVHVQRFPHLRLDDAKVSPNMAKDARQLSGGNVVWVVPGLVRTPEQGSNDQTYCPMKYFLCPPMGLVQPAYASAVDHPERCLLRTQRLPRR